VAGRQSNRDDRTHAHMRAIVPMLVMVVTVFILCWSPILVFEVLQAYSIIGAQVFGEVKHIKTFFSLLAYVNSCINPLIYGFMSKNFRRSFTEALCQCNCQPRARDNPGLPSHDKSSFKVDKHLEKKSWFCNWFPWSGRSVKECNCADPFSLSCPYHNSESGQRLRDAEQEKRMLGSHDNGDNQEKEICPPALAPTTEELVTEDVQFMGPNCNCQEIFRQKVSESEGTNKTQNDQM